MTAIIEKVTGYVTRLGASGAHELLVFLPQGDTVGVQVPAGTVEPGEKIEAAAWREMAEETGLKNLSLIRFLGSIQVPLTDESRAPLQDVVLRDRPGVEHGPGILLPRAHWSQVSDRTDGYAHLLAGSASGWMRADLLAERMDRYFYHFAAPADTPDQWTVFDDPHTFACYWVPLHPRPELDHEAQVWADEYYEKLLTSIG